MGKVTDNGGAAMGCKAPTPPPEDQVKPSPPPPPPPPRKPIPPLMVIMIDGETREPTEDVNRERIRQLKMKERHDGR